MLRGVHCEQKAGCGLKNSRARASTLQGETVKSRAAYQNFLTLWKDADPDIPILKEATAEYTKLQNSYL